MAAGAVADHAHGEALTAGGLVALRPLEQRVRFDGEVGPGSSHAEGEQRVDLPPFGAFDGLLPADVADERELQHVAGGVEVVVVRSADVVRGVERAGWARRGRASRCRRSRTGVGCEPQLVDGHGEAEVALADRHVQVDLHALFVDDGGRLAVALLPVAAAGFGDGAGLEGGGELVEVARRG